MSLSIKAARVRGGARLPGRPMGDPGLLGDIFGGIKGAVTGGVGALLSGGNPITGAVGGAVRGFTGPTRPRPSAPSGPIALPQPGGPIPGPGMMIGRFGPPSTNGKGAPGTIQSPAGTTIACPSGTHPNKSSYFLRDGSFVPEGSRCVKNRRRNPMNPRALRRAVGRVEGAKVWQGKLAEISTGKWTAAGKRKDKC